MTSSRTGTTPEYGIGDVVEGWFECCDDGVGRGIVRGRVDAHRERGKDIPAGFFGDSIDYVPGKGYGIWGYDRQIKAVRPATPEDEAAARATQARVEADTERLLRG